jgi:hypothetical protein
LFKISAQKQPENRADLTIKTNFQPKTANKTLSGKIKKDIDSAPKPSQHKNFYTTLSK